jgi:membrane carboxypeptidase/penicillin-binding protein PbpC
VTERVVEVWPLEVEAWLQRNGLLRDGAVNPSAMPRHAPGCPSFPEEGKPRILSPAEGEEYLITDAPHRQDIVFSAAASPGTETLHWFVDGDLVARGSPAREVPWTPSRGSHLIRCMDDRGRVTSVRFRVR